MQNLLKDSINRINNGQKYGFSEIELISSRLTICFLKFLYSEGLICGFKNKKNKITVFFKYFGGKPSILSIKNISTKNKRVYMSYKEVVQCWHLKEIFIILTPNGFISTKNIFGNSIKCGGEVICKIV
jgi:ribosomal protein S8